MCDGPQWVRAFSFMRFSRPYTTQQVGRAPLDKELARRRGLYLTTHNTHNRQISMSPVGFEPKISAGERPQTYALDRAATGTDERYEYIYVQRITTALFLVLHKGIA